MGYGDVAQAERVWLRLRVSLLRPEWASPPARVHRCNKLRVKTWLIARRMIWRIKAIPQDSVA
jgi:hypothetical protein